MYTPISCSIYDQLEAFAVQGVEVTLIYRNSGNEEMQVTTMIQDLQTRNHVEYLVTTSGQEIRLDHLVSVNQIPVAGTCGL